MSHVETVKTDFFAFLRTESNPGSNKPASYSRAIDLLEDILPRRAPAEFQISDIWSIQSPETIRGLYEFVRVNQRLGDEGIFAGEEPASYWKNGFMSAALKSFCDFLVVNMHIAKLSEMVVGSALSPEALSKELQEEKIDAIDAMLFVEDTASWEGKEVLRATKARVNQHFFRRLILEAYDNKCCLTGMGIPDFLIASHIVPWAEDAKNRLNPRNGLCLNALHDKAFDRGLISFDDECRLLLSPRLSGHCDNATIVVNFAEFEGRPLAVPERFPPDPAFLAKHRKAWKI